jgi:Zn-dependent metalloprotease
LYLKDGVKVTPGSILSGDKRAVGLTERDEFVPARKSKEKINGYSFIRYRQFHNGIPVEGGQFTEHLQHDEVKIAHGNLVEFDAPKSPVSLYSKQGIRKRVMKAIGATTYSWDLSQVDTVLAVQDSAQSPSSPPEPELVFAPVNGNRGKRGNQRHTLCWKVKVTTIEPTFNILAVYINAKNGKIENIQSLMRSHSNSADLNYGYGRQQIDVRYYNAWFGRSYYYLRALDNARNITTKSWESGKQFHQMSDERWYFGDNNFIWPLSEAGHTTAHWTVSNAMDYFKSAHGQEGWDDNSAHIQVNTEAPVASPGYGNGTLFFGRNPSLYSGDGATLDIAGHEWVHGLFDEWNILEYAREPGALNESFADIFGVMAERFANIEPFDWEVGEDAFVPIALRNMANPHGGLFPQPDVYQGLFWHTIPNAAPDGTNDFQGVHTNSGVQNRWFSLLADGGFHNGVVVQGIGIENAARVAFVNMERFLQLTSQYADAREGAINAARILFGDCSFEMIQTTNAWAAVGVGNVFNGDGCISVSGPTFACSDIDQFPLRYTASVPPGATVSWSFPSNFTGSTSGVGNSTLTITDFNLFLTGNQSVLITATSSLGGSESVTVRIEQCLEDDTDCDPWIEFCRTGPEGEQLADNRAKLLEDELNIIQITTYPNPAIREIRFGIESYLEINVTVTDMSGRIAKSVRNTTTSRPVHVADLPPGTYLVRLVSTDGRHSGLSRFVKY